MRGWTDEELKNPDLLAPCGLYCGVCGVYIAHRDGNEKLRNLLASLYGSAPEDTVCKGCMQPDPPECLYGYCQSCKIRDCVRDKGLTSCHPCADWPCEHIEAFPVPVGRRVMERAIPQWRDHVAKHGDQAGSEAWARAEAERYHCPDCGHPLFRGATRCRACRRDVADELDGRN